jgi:hypothetical protein
MVTFFVVKESSFRAWLFLSLLKPLSKKRHLTLIKYATGEKTTTLVQKI